MKYIPKLYQKLGITHLVNNRKANLFATPGMGKTSMTLTALLQADLVEEVFPVLIVSTKRIAKSVWSDEAARWDHTKHLVVKPLLGTPKQRLAALYTDADIYTINIENMQWLEKQSRAGMFKTIVMDESTKLRGCRAQLRENKDGEWMFRKGGTQNASSVVKLGMTADRRINLTGTPTPNGLKDLWGPQFFLDHGRTLGTAFSAYMNRWFRLRAGSMREAPIYDPVSGAFEDIMTRMASSTLSLDAKDWFDLREVRTVDIDVELPEPAKAMYKQAQKELLVKLSEDTTVGIASAGVLTQKLSQISNGFLFHEGGDSWEYFHEAKLEALDDLISELGDRPLIVTYHYRPELERLLKRYPQARTLDATAEADWNAGKIPLLLVHPQSAGHGLNLHHGGCDMAILNPTWDLELYQQVIERIGPTRQQQAGYDRQVNIYRIFGRNTVEKVMLDRLTSKATLQQSVLDAASVLP